MPLDELRKLARRIVEVAADDRLLGTDHDAARLQAHFQSMRAEIAFGGGVCVRINVQRVVRAGLHARLAADAAVGIEIDDAILAAVEGGDGADRHARRKIAVITAHHAEQPAIIWKLALLDVLNPGAIDANRYLMFAFAGHGTGVAADAFSVVDQESKGRHRTYDA